VTATTHTEIYRRFKGELEPARPAFVTLYQARLRLTMKKKLPLLILLVPPWISGIVFSFLAYTKFTVESGSALPGMSPATALGGSFMGNLIQVHSLIVTFTHVSRVFALLAITWYGAGLICEDRRAGAHLLYFSRPLTRLDYFLAHYATACTFGAIVVLGPALLICLVAVFSSPDYSFLTDKWDVIVGAVGYSLINVAVLSLVVLAVSSLSSRKTYALAGVFGLVLGSDAIGLAMSALQRDRDFGMMGLLVNFRRLADWLMNASATWSPLAGPMMNAPRTGFDWNGWWSVLILGCISLVAAATIANRLRRMEVVA
jgi:ABC-type transport system involved in multi-copper enzyme maturation permease subunit